LVTRHAKEFFVTDTLAKFLRANTVARAIVGTRINIDRAVRSLPLEVAVAGSVVANTVVRAVVKTLGHGAIEPIPSLVARALHRGTRRVLLGSNADSMARAVNRTLLSVASSTTIAASAVANALNTKPAVAAISRARGFNVADIALPSLLAIAGPLETVPVARAIRDHLAALLRAVGAGPSLVAVAQIIVA